MLATVNNGKKLSLSLSISLCLTLMHSDIELHFEGNRNLKLQLSQHAFHINHSSRALQADACVKRELKTGCLD